jgi:hypothetical protein
MDTWRCCTPDGCPPIVGKTYNIVHSRKGKFQAKVDRVNSPFAYVTVTERHENARVDVGEEVGVRNSLCTMTPVK